jgi:hypothetical protein
MKKNPKPPVPRLHIVAGKLAIVSALMVAGSAIVNGCDVQGFYYVPKHSVSRPPAVSVANTPEAKACWRTCVQTHEISAGNCREAYTQYNGRRIEQEIQQCVDRADDSRDSCLKTCPGST